MALTLESPCNNQQLHVPSYNCLVTPASAGVIHSVPALIDIIAEVFIAEPFPVTANVFAFQSETERGFLDGNGILESMVLLLSV